MSFSVFAHPKIQYMTSKTVLGKGHEIRACWVSTQQSCMIYTLLVLTEDQYVFERSDFKPCTSLCNRPGLHNELNVLLLTYNFLTNQTTQNLFFYEIMNLIYFISILSSFLMNVIVFFVLFLDLIFFN